MTPITRQDLNDSAIGQMLAHATELPPIEPKPEFQDRYEHIEAHADMQLEKH